jgi:uncharacterized DUF497 family protein
MNGPFLWNEEKSKELLRKRGLSFQMVVEAFRNGHLLDNLAHPDPMRSHQRIFIVRIEGKVCVVPYVIDQEVKFLKTIYPSRKHQLIYGG